MQIRLIIDFRYSDNPMLFAWHINIVLWLPTEKKKQ